MTNEVTKRLAHVFDAEDTKRRQAVRARARRAARATDAYGIPPWERDPRVVPCPSCGSGSPVSCVTASGRTTAPHKARVVLAHRYIDARRSGQSIKEAMATVKAYIECPF